MASNETGRTLIFLYKVNGKDGKKPSAKDEVQGIIRIKRGQRTKRGRTKGKSENKEEVNRDFGPILAYNFTFSPPTVSRPLNPTLHQSFLVFTQPLGGLGVFLVL